MTNTSTTHPADRLAAAIDRAGTVACVGIDPVAERLPDPLNRRPGPPIDAIRSFCFGVVDAVSGVVGVVKPQSACFERHGSAGMKCLEQAVARARDRGLVVILDAKRGDIGTSAAHYAAAVSGMGAEWVTVNGYLGPSGIEPFFTAGLGVFVLVRTSNPDSDAIQSAELAGGETVAERVAAMVDTLGGDRRGSGGLSSAGAVVGATKAGDDGARLRAAMPDAPLLVPGVGAQGGSVAGLAPMLRDGARTLGQGGIVVSASRSVLYPAKAESDRGWQGAVHAAAESFVEQLAAIKQPSNTG